MKTFGIRHAMCCALLLGLAACAGDENGGTTANPQDPPAAGTVDDVDVNVPTAEEAQATANQSINESNADAEFEKLKKEIEGDS